MAMVAAEEGKTPDDYLDYDAAYTTSSPLNLKTVKNGGLGNAQNY